jgi:hypothetical protein
LLLAPAAGAQTGGAGKIVNVARENSRSSGLDSLFADLERDTRPVRWNWLTKAPSTGSSR